MNDIKKLDQAWIRWTSLFAFIGLFLFMMVFAKAVGDFVARHPTVKMLALSFLILIGTALIGEGFHFEIPKGYIYCSMGFSMVVELLNLKAKKKTAAKS